MASPEVDACTNYPDFAVICSFIENFGEKLNTTFPNIGELQKLLEDTTNVSPVLIQTLGFLLRRINKGFKADRWEKGVQKFVYTYNHKDAWEVERCGFLNTKLEIKLRILKNLLEKQFDLHKTFKEKINAISANDLRLQPCGRDKFGVSYWCQIDECANLRVYKDDQDEETWELVAKTKEEVLTLIDQLQDTASSVRRETSVDGSQSGTATPMVLSEAATPVASGRASPVLDSSEKQEDGVPIVNDLQDPLSLPDEKSKDSEEERLQAHDTTSSQKPDKDDTPINTPVEDDRSLEPGSSNETSIPASIDSKIPPDKQLDNKIITEEIVTSDPISSKGEPLTSDPKTQESLSDESNADAIKPVKDESQDGIIESSNNTKNDVMKGSSDCQESSVTSKKDEQNPPSNDIEDNSTDKSQPMLETEIITAEKSSIIPVEDEKPLISCDSKLPSTDTRVPTPVESQSKEPSHSDEQQGNLIPGESCTKEEKQENISSTSEDQKTNSETIPPTAMEVLDKEQTNQTNKRKRDGDDDEMESISKICKMDESKPEADKATKTNDLTEEKLEINQGKSTRETALEQSKAEDLKESVESKEEPVPPTEPRESSIAEEKVSAPAVEFKQEVSKEDESTTSKQDSPCTEPLKIDEKTQDLPKTEASEVKESSPNPSEFPTPETSVSTEEKNSSADEPSSSNAEENSELPEEAIVEPVMVIKGDGEGALCESDNPWWENFDHVQNPGEDEVVEEVMFFWGHGSGADCEGGNEEEMETVENGTSSQVKLIEKSQEVILPEKNKQTPLPEVNGSDLNSSGDSIRSSTEGPVTLSQDTSGSENKSDPDTSTRVNEDSPDLDKSKQIDSNLNIESSKETPQITNPVDSEGTSLNSNAVPENKLTEKTLDGNNVPTSSSESSVQKDCIDQSDELVDASAKTSENKTIDMKSDVTSCETSEKKPDSQKVPDVETCKDPSDGSSDSPVPEEIKSEDVNPPSEKESIETSEASNEKEETDKTINSSLTDTNVDSVTPDKVQESVNICVEKSETSGNASKDSEQDEKNPKVKSDDPSSTAEAKISDVAKKVESPPPDTKQEESPELNPPTPDKVSDTKSETINKDDASSNTTDSNKLQIKEETSTKENEQVKEKTSAKESEEIKEETSIKESEEIKKESEEIKERTSAKESEGIIEKSSAKESEGIIEKTSAKKSEEIKKETYTKESEGMKEETSAEESEEVKEKTSAKENEEIKEATSAKESEEIKEETSAKKSEGIKASEEVKEKTSAKESEGIKEENVEKKDVTEDIAEKNVESEVSAETVVDPEETDPLALTADDKKIEEKVNTKKTPELDDTTGKSEKEEPKNITSEPFVPKKPKGRGRPRKGNSFPRQKSHPPKASQKEEESDVDGEEDEEEESEPQPTPKKKKPEPEVTRHRSARIAKIREREEAERIALEGKRLEQLALENKRRARDERRVGRESKKDRKPDKEKHKKKKKKKKKAKKSGNDPWAHSSSSSSSSSDDGMDFGVLEEENEELVFKSDHEFSPESELEDEDAQPIKRARTAHKGKIDPEPKSEETEDDTSCAKCSHQDHPETILLCDNCDAGWHLSCLRPPLLSVPEGDWTCPSCEHNALIDKLKSLVSQYDALKKKAENEEMRRQRLAYINISLDNALPDVKEHKKRRPHKEKKEKREKKDDEESGSDSEEESGSGSLTSSSSDTDSDTSGPLYTLRARPSRTPKEQVQDFDELINEAIRLEEEESVPYTKKTGVGRGKDIANIMEGEVEEEPYSPEEKMDEDEEVDVPPMKEEKDVTEKKEKKPKEEKPEPAKRKRDFSEEDSDYPSDDSRKAKPKKKRRAPVRKRRRLTDLDAVDEDEDDSDESFNGSSDLVEDSDESMEESSFSSSYDIESDTEDSDEEEEVVEEPARSSSSLRRSSRARRNLPSDYESEPEKTTKKSRRNDSSSEEETSSDDSYVQEKPMKKKSAPPPPKKKQKKKPMPKKVPPKAPPKKTVIKTPPKNVKPKPKPRVRYSKPAVKEDEDEDPPSKRRVTRGRQMTYFDSLYLSDEDNSEDEKPKSRGKVMKGERRPTESSEYEESDDEMKRRRGVRGGLGRGKVMQGEDEDSDSSKSKKKKPVHRGKPSAVVASKPETKPTTNSKPVSVTSSLKSQDSPSAAKDSSPLSVSHPVDSMLGSSSPFRKTVDPIPVPTAMGSSAVKPFSETPQIQTASSPQAASNAALSITPVAYGAKIVPTPQEFPQGPHKSIGSPLSVTKTPLVDPAKALGRSSPGPKWSPHITRSGTPPRHPLGSGTPPRPAISGSITASPPLPYRSSPIPIVHPGSVSQANISTTIPSTTTHPAYPPYGPPEHYASHPGFPPGYPPRGSHPPGPPRHSLPPGHAIYGPPHQSPYPAPHHPGVLRGPDMYRHGVPGRGSPTHPPITSHPHPGMMKSPYHSLEPLPFSESPGPIDATGRSTEGSPSRTEDPKDPARKAKADERTEFSSGLFSYFSSQREEEES